MSVDEPYDTLASDAEDGDERDLGVFPNPSVDDCPIVFLGFDGPRVVFAMPEGEIRAEPAAKIGQMLRADIMACAAGQAFLTNWRDRKEKFHRDLAAIWFVRRCREGGKWDPSRQQRGPGVWPGGAGEVLLHRGDAVEVWKGGRRQDELTIAEALKRRHGPIYRLHPATTAADDPCGPEVGLWARRHMDAWRFEAIGDEGLTGADVVAGFVGLALLGAVAPFRAHVILDAVPGSGKTTFLAFVHALLSALAGELVNSFTDAGLRKEISGMARPLVVDEAESAAGDLGPGPVEQVLNYLRLMATGEGANRKQADAAQTAVGAVLMAAANPPQLDHALATRVAEVRMRRLPKQGADPDPDDPAPPRPRLTDADLEAAVAKAREVAPALLGRALSLAGRYREDLAAIKAALVEAGEGHRSADLIASLAAGRRLLTTGDPVDADEAALEVERWRALAVERSAGDGDRNQGQEALAHLLGADAGLQRGGARSTLGELLEAHAHSEHDYEGILKEHGLQVLWQFAPDGREGPWLMVANAHPGTARIFGRTEWKAWSKVLSALDELGPEHRTWKHKGLWFGAGRKSRALAIPLAPWLEKPIRPRSGDRSGPRSGASA